MVLVGLLPINAQYSFTLNASWSGNCSGYTAQMNQAIRGFQSQAINGFPTRELCEQTRSAIPCAQINGDLTMTTGQKGYSWDWDIVSKNNMYN